MNEEGEKSELRDSHTNTSPGSKPSYSLLDPNPSLIDINGNLINNINLAASLTTYRNGTIADGVSKLLIRIPYNSKLQFTIKDLASDDLSDGKLSSLIPGSLGEPMLSSSSVSVDSQRPTNGNPVVIAVYTPPDSFNQHIGSNKTIKINVSEPNNNSTNLVLDIPILLYRPPVVLVHGVWINSDITWVQTKFAECLSDNGFYYAFADYEEHNSETFDPCDKVFGNYGINSIRNTVRKALQDHHHFLIAASQVDIIAHSMGGLMARGFVQQPDYKVKENYMKGSIHRLITIGTPHFGGPLSRFLYKHIDDWYFYDGTKPNRCRIDKIEPMKLRNIYSDLKISIDKGAIEALIPNSIAYSHLHQTNVKSFAIAGNYRPHAMKSHDFQESYYKAVVDPEDFALDKDAFDGCDNDLLVSITSQLGGLPKHHSAIYCNTVHEGFYIKDDSDANISSETNSKHIQDDVVRLLSFSDSNKFADIIGKDPSKGFSK